MRKLNKIDIGQLIAANTKKIILGLTACIVIGGGLFAYDLAEDEKLANAPTISINLIEGQNYSFENKVKKLEGAERYGEFLDFSAEDQRIYALENYTGGRINLLGKLSDGTYEKYSVSIIEVDTETEREVSVVRETTTTIQDWNTDFKAEWSSSNESIATVDNDGKVTGHRLGSCDIIANINSGVKVVYHVTVVDVTLSPADSYVYLGEVINYQLMGYRVAEGENLELTSSNPDVASVWGMKVRGKAEGVTQLSLNLAGKTYTTTLNVYGEPSVEDVILTVDSEAEAVVHNLPGLAECSSLEVKNEKIAEIRDGKIYGKEIGTTQVNGKMKDYEFSFNITVAGAALVPDTEAVYDTNYKENANLEGLTRYSVVENETLRINLTNAKGIIPTVTSDSNNFRIYEATSEYIEVIGTNPGIGVLNVDFGDTKLYAEIHVQHTDRTMTRRQWEVQVKTFTDELKENKDWTYGTKNIKGSYTEAKESETKVINGIALINYALQKAGVFTEEQFMTIKNYKINGNAETMEVVKDYMEVLTNNYKTPLKLSSLQVGDIVIWKNGEVSVYVGNSANGTATWYEANKGLIEDGVFGKFYLESAKSKVGISQILRQHYIQ